ncbi:MAG: hypothetical protein K2X77_00410 [Candidatus Obscuribacterales bacterium]|jgi:hypothetical protein|nr:hypothetical protein [Candidatus Obscuribacterales bacterium]
MKMLNGHTLTSLCWCLIGVLFVPAAYAQMSPTADPSKISEANGGYVFLNSNVAAMAERAYGLPKTTQTYPLAGMTVFPYYQASEPLKAFLNTTTFMGKPITAFPFQPNIPTISLPMTDLVRRSIPLPNPSFQKSGAVKMAVIDKKNRDEVPWMVAHQGGQAFQIPGDADALALVAQGSMFSACATRTMVLRCGLMWVMTGARPAAVLTKDAAIVVKPYGIAAVETTWTNQMRVINFAGQPVEMQLAYDGKTDKVTVEKGIELAVSETLATKNAVPGTTDSSASESIEALNPTNPEVVNPILQKMASPSPVPTAVSGLSVSSGAIDAKANDLLKELTTISPPFSNPKMSTDFTRMFASYGITAAMRGEAIRKRTLAKHNIATKTAISNLGKTVPPVSVPAGTTNLATSHGLTLPPAVQRPTSEELKSLRLAKGRARVFASSEINIEQNGRPYLALGEGIFIAQEPMVIRTNTFSVHLRAGATVQMVARKEVILVRNLGEEQPNSVKIRMGDHIFDCGVGGELVAGSSAPAIFDEMRVDGIARRNVQSTEAMHGTVVINKGEVSLTSLIQHSPIMRKLYKSHDEGDKRLMADLMKTIVAMNIVTSGRGNYRTMSGLSGVH